MRPIFIFSTKGHSGKTFLCLGLGLMLKKQGYNVGYMKPIGRAPVKRGKDIIDADAISVSEALSLSDEPSMISPFILDYETQRLLYERKIKTALGPILSSFKALKRGKDFFLVEGPGDLLEGSSFNVDPMRLVPALKADVLLIEQWAGDESTDSVIGAKNLFGERLLGVLINKAPQSQMDYISKTVLPYLRKKTNVFGLFMKDSVLGAVSIRRLVELLGGRVLCCEEKIDELVENFSIGAMDVESALRYFQKTPNKAVITGAHRADIQLAALETSTKCLILTGGLYTNDVVLGRAVSKGVPVVSVSRDTFSTIEAIEGLIGRTGISEKEKINRAYSLFEDCFDMEGFLNLTKGRAIG